MLLEKKRKVTTVHHKMGMDVRTKCNFNALNINYEYENQ